MVRVELDYARARPPPGDLAGAGRADLPPGVSGTLNLFFGALCAGNSWRLKASAGCTGWLG
jgi:hypothetical protein